MTDTKYLLLACVALAGCATRIDNGAFHFVTYANAMHLTVSGPGITLSADGLNHSTPTASAFFGVAHVTAAAGTAAIPFATGSAVLKAAPLIPATVPSINRKTQP